MNFLVATFWTLLADAEAAAKDGGGAPAGPGLGGMLPPIIIMVVLYYFLIIRGDNKRREAQLSLRNAIKKNDRVVTTSGIYGIVANVQREQNRVKLKIDEATNATIEVTFDSIGTVLSDSTEPAKETKDNKETNK